MPTDTIFEADCDGNYALHLALYYVCCLSAGLSNFIIYERVVLLQGHEQAAIMLIPDVVTSEEELDLCERACVTERLNAHNRHLFTCMSLAARAHLSAVIEVLFSAGADVCTLGESVRALISLYLHLHSMQDACRCRRR